MRTFSLIHYERNLMLTVLNLHDNRSIERNEKNLKTWIKQKIKESSVCVYMKIEVHISRNTRTRNMSWLIMEENSKEK